LLQARVGTCSPIHFLRMERLSGTILMACRSDGNTGTAKSTQSAFVAELKWSARYMCEEGSNRTRTHRSLHRM